MLRARADRRIATALFVDVVDSTRISAELGDQHWRSLLSTFRSIVRRQLRRHGGREVDTAGYGFFATFASPAGALRAAAGIVADVQARGLDVRCGVHTGELDRIEGRLGGIGAAIGSRVMGRAGAAEVLTTGTVRDLVVGGAATFEPFGDVELKGVPGRWTLYRLTALDGRSLPTPLVGDEAASRRAVERGGGRGRTHLAALAGGGIVVAAATFAIIQLGRTDAGADGSASPSPSPPIALLKIDPGEFEIVRTVRDPSLPPFGSSVQIADGNLWYSAGSTLVRRDLATGEVISAPIELPAETWDIEPGFGSIWVGHGMDQAPAHLPSLIDRVNATSGRVEEIDPGIALWDMAVGEEAVYLLGRRSRILELDPNSNEIVDRDATGTKTEPVYISYYGGRIVLSEPGEHRLTQFDPDTDTVVGELEAPQLGLGAGAIDPLTGDLWIADRDGYTITEFNLRTGESQAPIGLQSRPHGLVFGLSSLWVAAEESVYRIDPVTHYTIPIPMPSGAVATSVGIDEETRTVWISTCAVSCED